MPVPCCGALLVVVAGGETTTGFFATGVGPDEKDVALVTEEMMGVTAVSFLAASRVGMAALSSPPVEVLVLMLVPFPGATILITIPTAAPTTRKPTTRESHSYVQGRGEGKSEEKGVIRWVGKRRKAGRRARKGRRGREGREGRGTRARELSDECVMLVYVYVYV